MFQVEQIKKAGKVALAVVLAAPMILSLQGCTDEEVAVGVGIGAIAVGATAIGVAAGHSDHHHHRPHGTYCESGYRRICASDYWGRYSCREVYDNCMYTRSYA